MYYSEFISLEIAFIYFYKDIFEEKICISRINYIKKAFICYKKICVQRKASCKRSIISKVKF